MKSFLPWLFALALLGGGILLFSANQKMARETNALRDETNQVQTLRTELEQLKTTGSPAQAEQIAQLQKDNQELLKLRNEVRQLRDDKKQFAQQAQAAQVQAQTAQAQAQAAQSQVFSLSTNLQAAQAAALDPEAARQKMFRERYGLAPATPEQQQLNTCINQLRQLDGAKQQWALENKKTATDTPTANDIAPYVGGGAIPKCPAGGTYTINSVAAAPTCIIRGHALPQ